MRFILISILFLSSAFGFSQEAEFFVKKSVFKFPKTNEGSIVEHSFSVKNTGDVPLILSSYEVECDCTKAFLPEKPIQPGETVDVKVTFDTDGKAYLQDRIIVISTNTKKGKEELRFKIYVKPKK